MVSGKSANFETALHVRSTYLFIARQKKFKQRGLFVSWFIAGRMIEGGELIRVR